MRPVRQTEQFVRSLILLTASAVFSVVAYFAGLFSLPNQNLSYACIVVVVVAAAIISRVGAKWVMRRLASSGRGVL
jgi:hypothetical protein